MPNQRWKCCKCGWLNQGQNTACGSISCDWYLTFWRPHEQCDDCRNPPATRPTQPGQQPLQLPHQDPPFPVRTALQPPAQPSAEAHVPSRSEAPTWTPIQPLQWADPEVGPWPPNITGVARTSHGRSGSPTEPLTWRPPVTTSRTPSPSGTPPWRPNPGNVIIRQPKPACVPRSTPWTCCQCRQTWPNPQRNPCGHRTFGGCGHSRCASCFSGSHQS